MIVKKSEPRLGNDRLVSISKFLGWLTAMLLSASVLVALLAVTFERDDLKDQINIQNIELVCRATATSDFFTARSNQNIALGNQSTVLGDLVVEISEQEVTDSAQLALVIERLSVANDALRNANMILDEVTKDQQDAISTCAD